MPIDVARYRHYLDEYDMTETAKDEFIHTLSAMLKSFVDREFGLLPEQMLPGRATAVDSISDTDRVESQERSATNHFSQAAGDFERQEGIDNEGD